MEYAGNQGLKPQHLGYVARSWVRTMLFPDVFVCLVELELFRSGNRWKCGHFLCGMFEIITFDCLIPPRPGLSACSIYCSLGGLEAGPLFGVLRGSRRSPSPLYRPTTSSTSHLIVRLGGSTLSYLLAVPMRPRGFWKCFRYNEA